MYWERGKNMSMIRQNNDRGSTIVFAIVGAVLLIGLIGTIYFVRQYSDQVRKDQAIAAYDKEQSDVAANETKNTDDHKTDKPSSVVGSNSSDTTEETPDSVASELPVTGVAISVNNLIGLYVLAFVLSSYVISRRSLKSSL